MKRCIFNGITCTVIEIIWNVLLLLMLWYTMAKRVTVGANKKVCNQDPCD